MEALGLLFFIGGVKMKKNFDPKKYDPFKTAIDRKKLYSHPNIALHEKIEELVFKGASNEEIDRLLKSSRNQDLETEV